MSEEQKGRKDSLENRMKGVREILKSKNIVSVGTHRINDTDVELYCSNDPTLDPLVREKISDAIYGKVGI